MKSTYLRTQSIRDSTLENETLFLARSKQIQISQGKVFILAKTRLRESFSNQIRFIYDKYSLNCIVFTLTFNNMNKK